MAGNEQVIEALGDERDEVIGEIEESLHALEKERNALREQVAGGQIEVARAKEKFAEIDGKYTEIVTGLKIANEKRQQIIDDYRLYRHQEKAKVVLPVIVALFAYTTSQRSGSDRVVDGFAGFGAASALEATGYGLGKPIGMLTFKVTSW